MDWKGARLVTTQETQTCHLPLKQILDLLYYVSYKWDDIGIQVGLHQGTIESIQCNNNSVKRRMWEVIIVWLKRGEASWRNLIEALRSRRVEEHSLAKEIKNIVAEEACK